MSTLTNVETRRGEANPPCVRLTLGIIPEAKSSQTGVSVEYVPTKDKKWFVFRASYGRENIAQDYILADGEYAYVARRYARKKVDGTIKMVPESLIPNFLFVYTTEAKAWAYVKDTPALYFLTFYYNHLHIVEGLKNPPLTVPDREMQNFIIATCTMNEHLMLIEESRCRFKSGETVRVIDGVFRGVEGRVARVCGQQRVVVSISSVGLISTAYIPTAFLQKVEEQNED